MILLKLVILPNCPVSLGGYIIERNFPYRNVILFNKSDKPIKAEVPVFDEEWIDKHKDLGLDVILVEYDDSFISLFRKVKADLECNKK